MITIHFDFKNRSPEELEQLNRILDTMKLQELRLEGTSGYLATTTDGEDNLIGYRYGLDSGTLVCRLAQGNHGYQYRIDSVVVDNSVENDEYLQIWREQHPDRVIRLVIRAEHGCVSGYLIAHHQRV